MNDKPTKDWNWMLENYGGVIGIADMIEQEGLAYFVHDYIGPEAFEGGPMEDAAKRLDAAITEMERFFG